MLQKEVTSSFRKLHLVGILCVALILLWQKEVTNAVPQCTHLRNEPVQLSFGRLWRFIGVAKFPLFLCVSICLFTSGCCWFCVSSWFSWQTFRTSVFVPRSPASNLKTIAANNSFWTVLVHEVEFSWFGWFFWQHVLCKQSKLIYNPSFRWGKHGKNDKKWASVTYHDSTLNMYFIPRFFYMFFHWTTFGIVFLVFFVWCPVILSLGLSFFGIMTGHSNSRHSKLRV